MIGASGSYMTKYACVCVHVRVRVGPRLQRFAVQLATLPLPPSLLPSLPLPCIFFHSPSIDVAFTVSLCQARLMEQYFRMDLRKQKLQQRLSVLAGKLQKVQEVCLPLQNFSAKMDTASVYRCFHLICCTLLATLVQFAWAMHTCNNPMRSHKLNMLSVYRRTVC